MTHPLDRPIWTALTTRHADLSLGDGLARRYPPAIVPFAAVADGSPEAARALEALLGPDDSIRLLQAEGLPLPPGLDIESVTAGVQMVAGERPPQAPDPQAPGPRIERLTAADAAEMLALATLTRPGPFTLEAQRLGEFWGVRIDGRLAAMAGERLRQPGWCELSGVCAHPDFRGRGLARLLSLHVADRIFARGETPYLHAYAANAAAIRLYQSIGFAVRSAMTVTAARRVAETVPAGAQWSDADGRSPSVS